MRVDNDANKLADNLYYEYWRDGVLQRCFKSHDDAIKHCKYEFKRYPQSTHCVYNATLHRECICCMVP